MRGGEAISTYAPIPDSEKFRIEYWALEEAKLRRMPVPGRHAGRIAFVTGAARRVDFLENAADHELLEPRGQDVAGRPQALLEFAEPPLAQKRVAHDQERPPIADHVERTRDRTRRMRQALAFHDLAPILASRAAASSPRAIRWASRISRYTRSFKLN